MIRGHFILTLAVVLAGITALTPLVDAWGGGEDYPRDQWTDNNLRSPETNWNYTATDSWYDPMAAYYDPSLYNNESLAMIRQVNPGNYVGDWSTPQIFPAGPGKIYLCYNDPALDGVSSYILKVSPYPFGIDWTINITSPGEVVSPAEPVFIDSAFAIYVNCPAEGEIRKYDADGNLAWTLLKGDFLPWGVTQYDPTATNGIMTLALNPAGSSMLVGSLITAGFEHFTALYTVGVEFGTITNGPLVFGDNETRTANGWFYQASCIGINSGVHSGGDDVWIVRQSFDDNAYHSLGSVLNYNGDSNDYWIHRWAGNSINENLTGNTFAVRGDLTVWSTDEGAGYYCSVMGDTTPTDGGVLWFTHGGEADDYSYFVVNDGQVSLYNATKLSTGIFNWNITRVKEYGVDLPALPSNVTNTNYLSNGIASNIVYSPGDHCLYFGIYTQLSTRFNSGEGFTVGYTQVMAQVDITTTDTQPGIGEAWQEVLTWGWASQPMNDVEIVHTSIDQTDPITDSEIYHMGYGQGSHGNLWMDASGMLFYGMKGDVRYNSDWDEYGPFNYHSDAYFLMGAYFIDTASGVLDPVQIEFGAYVDNSGVFYNGACVADPVGVGYDPTTSTLYWMNGLDFNRLALHYGEPEPEPEPAGGSEEHSYSMYLYIMAAAGFILLVFYFGKR